MDFSHSKKEIKYLFNHIENTCENLYKSFSNEAKKASSEFLLNPKKIEAQFKDWQVDLTVDLDKLKELDPAFFNEIKGKIHSFEQSAKRLIRVYKNKPEEKDGATQFDYFTDLQNAEDELKNVLNNLFQTIKAIIF